jgi:HTH-type transcriptional regulator/antitoxin HigA
MIRALHEGLGIPADALLQEQGASLPEEANLDVSRFPWSAMLKHKWFPGFNGTTRDAKENAEELLSKLFSALSGGDLRLAHYRCHVRSGSEMDSYALLVWRARVVSLAKASPLPSAYKKGSITKDFMNRLVQLSYLDDGPKLAREFLHKNGIHLIVERHLPKTHLDGAATVLDNGAPVVGMTLRHDRLDNFWFCLCHELGHVAKHLAKPDAEWFFDDLDIKDGDKKEDEADKWAQESLIPSNVWNEAPTRVTHAVSDVRELAERLRIHPAIVAGRIRWDNKDYRILSRLLGQGEVRKHFSEEMGE